MCQTSQIVFVTFLLCILPIRRRHPKKTKTMDLVTQECCSHYLITSGNLKLGSSAATGKPKANGMAATDWTVWTWCTPAETGSEMRLGSNHLDLVVHHNGKKENKRQTPTSYLRWRKQGKTLKHSAPGLTPAESGARSGTIGIFIVRIWLKDFQTKGAPFTLYESLRLPSVSYRKSISTLPQHVYFFPRASSSKYSSPHLSATVKDTR